MEASLLFIIVIAMIPPVIWTTGHLIDDYLLNGGDEDEDYQPGALLIFSSLFGIVVIATSFFFSRDMFSILDKHLFEVLLLIFSGVCYTTWVGLYLFALKDETPLKIIPYFQTVPVFMFIIDALVFNSFPNRWEIIGSCVLMTGGIVLALDIKGLKFRKKIAILMLSAAFLVAVNGATFDHAAGKLGMGYWTPIFWQYVGATLSGILLFIFVPNFRKQFFSVFSKKKGIIKIISLNSFNEILEMGCHLTLFYSLIIGQNTMVTSIANASEPVMLLFASILIVWVSKLRARFSKKNRKIISWEDVEPHRLPQTITAVSLLFVGFCVILVSDGNLLREIMQLFTLR